MSCLSRHLVRTIGPFVLVTATIALAAACGSSNSSASTPPSTVRTGSYAGSSAAASSSAPALSGTLTVFAAASLTGSFGDLGASFEAAHPGTTVKFSFGASSALAQQILAGAPADLFASASPKNMAQVTDAKDADAPVTFATNTAEIAVAPASAAKITGIGELAAPGVKVALCQPQVPCGALATKVLANAKIKLTPVTQGLDVKSTLAYVTGGQADAAIVYVTDVKAAGQAVTGVDIPAADNASTAYPIATVTDSKNKDLGNAFEQYVLSPAGQGVLSEAGFAKP